MTAAEVDGTRNPNIGLVLAGGGARGAYEAGAVAALVPALEARGELPGLVLGTSIGALNATHLAATAHLSATESLDKLIKLWHKVQFSDIIGPLASPREIVRLLHYFGGLLPSLLDTSPMPGVLRELIDVDQLHANIDHKLASLAVVATSYATGNSVVFYEGFADKAPQPDLRRGIDYFPTRIDTTHVQASASIPAAFPATMVETPTSAAGWYGDGGTRLNTPIKPTLEFGAKRVVVIGLNSTALPLHPQGGRPDVFAGAAQFVQALFADPIAQDVETLAGHNVEIGKRSGAKPAAGGRESVPYIFIAPRDRLTVGELAAETFRKHLSGVKAFVRARDLVTLGTLMGAGKDGARGEVFSFLFFATEFHKALIDLGRQDAERWLADNSHDDWPWRTGPPPAPPSKSVTSRP